LPAEQASQYAGQTITCTRCQRPFAVPAAVAAREIARPASDIPLAAAAFSPPDERASATVNAPADHYAYVAPRTSALAITALVLGVLGIAFPPIGLVGIVLGIIALVKIARDPGQTGKGIAVGGIGAAVLGFAAWGCFASLALPSLGQARRSAQQVACAANLRAIGQALAIYASQNNNRYPDRLDQVVSIYGGNGQIFVCPASDDTPAVGTPQQVEQQIAAGQHVSYVFVAPGWSPGGGGGSARQKVVAYEPLHLHPNGGMNVLWGDGRVSFEGAASAQRILQRLAAATQPATDTAE
jgi:prepilin-type processing-associated H-X9-DG protein